MNNQNHRFQCKKCSHGPFLVASGSYGDGSLRMLCPSCAANGGVLHRCHFESPFSLGRLLPLVLAGIEIACPNCKAAYDLGVKVEPLYPQAGEFLQKAGLFVGGIFVIGMIARIFQDRNRGRR
jgi:hypothetical protein